MKYNINVKNITLSKSNFKINIYGELIDSRITPNKFSFPRITLHFNNETEDRRIPFPIQLENIIFLDGKCIFWGTYNYFLDNIFWKTKNITRTFSMHLNLGFIDFYEEKINIDLTPDIFNSDSETYSLEFKNNQYIFTRLIIKFNKLKTLSKKMVCFSKSSIIFIYLFMRITFNKILFYIQHIKNKKQTKILLSDKKRKQFNKYLLNIIYNFKKVKKVQHNKITFYSARNHEITDNFKFIYDKIKDDKELNINFLFNTNNLEDLTFKELLQLADACATSKVIILNEYTPQIHLINLKPETKLIQLWHACGAFKTFGFSRITKPSGAAQTSPYHRSYDYATVSSSYCKKVHSEAFGIATNNVVPTGIARTDIFFDKQHKESVKQEFYEKYPSFKNKKIILFAPTFRGALRKDAFYPMHLFDIKKVCEYLGPDYAVIIKHHPFITESHYIPPEYSDRVIDLSSGIEINDLLFVVNFVITDYSSLIFDASILNLPMFFYAYDLQAYILSRDFYIDYTHYVPGKICTNLTTLLKAIKNNDYNIEKIENFKNMFFDNLDGKSSERIAKLLYEALK